MKERIVKDKKVRDEMRKVEDRLSLVREWPAIAFKTCYFNRRTVHRRKGREMALRFMNIQR